MSSDKTVQHHVDVKLRESKGVRRLELTVLQEGRASAASRRELFVMGSLSWPDGGVHIRSVHLGTSLGRAHPSRRPDGSIEISTPANDAMVKAIEQEGKTGASIEFVPIRERRTRSGVTEYLRAWFDGVALVTTPEFSQGKARIRSRRERSSLWRL